LEDLILTNISGASNINFIIECKKREEKGLNKFVLRMVFHQVTDFETEKIIFRALAARNLCPRELDVGSNYRVEEFFEGRNLTFLEMMNPQVKEKLIEKLCDVNYDSELMTTFKAAKPTKNHFVYNVIEEGGWLETYLTKVRPSIVFPEEQEPTKDIQGAREILTYFDKVFHSKEKFISEYTSLIPPNQREGLDVVFSHNDFQENNVMVENNDKSKMILIDFEFSMLNFRGFDLGALFNESYIDYIVKSRPAFKFHEELFDFLLQRNEIDHIARHYLKHYHGKFYQGEKTSEQFLEEELPILKDQITRAVLLEHLLWAVWALVMMTPSDLHKSMDFYLPYA